ncbi:hypothetical protein GCM10010124_08820 [Pilimelia terevasa]|uniref:Uncharacterized protein n=1 Tax=Pilimelia terevasa TaxID=53372 RepID=A0A8J3BKW2_9ACTN|nr:hypothetical protein [Pilimelia terevasa]GGK18471.1 hypothetical protein GCM10010124_08820 [Pilimelia terevasa]
MPHVVTLSPPTPVTDTLSAVPRFLAAESAPALTGLTFVLVVLGVFTAYGLGFAHATFRRARKDYTVTRRSLPNLRKGAFAALTTTVGRLVLVAAVVAATMAWSATHGSPPPR